MGKFTYEKYKNSFFPLPIIRVQAKSHSHFLQLTQMPGSEDPVNNYSAVFLPTQHSLSALDQVPECRPHVLSLSLYVYLT